MTGRQWLLGMGLVFSVISLLVLAWMTLMITSEKAAWTQFGPVHWLVPALIILNLVNLPLLVFNLRRRARPS